MASRVSVRARISRPSSWGTGGQTFPSSPTPAQKRKSLASRDSFLEGGGAGRRGVGEAVVGVDVGRDADAPFGGRRAGLGAGRVKEGGDALGEGVNAMRGVVEEVGGLGGVEAGGGAPDLLLPLRGEVGAHLGRVGEEEGLDVGVVPGDGVEPNPADGAVGAAEDAVGVLVDGTAVDRRLVGGDEGGGGTAPRRTTGRRRGCAR